MSDLVRRAIGMALATTLSSVPAAVAFCLLACGAPEARHAECVAAEARPTSPVVAIASRDAASACCQSTPVLGARVFTPKAEFPPIVAAAHATIGADATASAAGHVLASLPDTSPPQSHSPLVLRI